VRSAPGAWCARPTGLVPAVRVDPAGEQGPTRRQAAGSRWDRIAPGLYVPSDRPTCVEQRILEQSARLPSTGAVTGWAALRWRGAAYFDGTDRDGKPLPVPLLLGGGNLRPHPGSWLSWEQLGLEEREVVDGVQVTRVPRAVFDEMRRVDSQLHRLVTVEMAVAAGLTTVGLMTAYVARRKAWTGISQVRETMPLAIDDSWPPSETWMRLVWLQSGLPPPLCNRPVYSRRGQLLGVPDLLDPVAGLVGEYQGAHHKGRMQHRKDVARADAFRNHGLEYFEVVAGDRHWLVKERMLAARARAKFLPPESCAWTLDPS
jgi:hypothetical protein